MNSRWLKRWRGYGLGPVGTWLGGVHDVLLLRMQQILLLFAVQEHMPPLELPDPKLHLLDAFCVCQPLVLC